MPRPSASTQKAEPEIYATTCQVPHTVIENMVFDPETNELDFERRQPDRKHALRLPAELHLERV